MYMVKVNNFRKKALKYKTKNELQRHASHLFAVRFYNIFFSAVFAIHAT